LDPGEINGKGSPHSSGQKIGLSPLDRKKLQEGFLEKNQEGRKLPHVDEKTLVCPKTAAGGKSL